LREHILHLVAHLTLHTGKQNTGHVVPVHC